MKDNIIRRAIDNKPIIETTNQINDLIIRDFKIDSHQDLKFTNIVEGTINGIKINNWQKALRIVVKLLIDNGINCDELISVSKLNIKNGIINKGGFNLIKGTNCSLQRVESNRAGKSLSALAKKYDLDINIRYKKTK